MAVATIVEINNDINSLKNALTNLNETEKGLTRNPIVDDNIATAYSKIQEAIVLLNVEGETIDN